jgi:branched-chain amino acid transport system substrate-binding protein
MAHIVRAFALLTALALSAPVSATAATSGEPFHIDVILSQTGAAAFLGTTETKALAVLEKVVNANGGIQGRPVQFSIVDDQSNPGTTVQLFNQIAARKPAAILGPGFTATCNAVLPLAKDGGPVTYCLSPSIYPQPGGYVFSGNVTSGALARVMFRYFRDRGFKKLAMITSTDASGADFVPAVNDALALPENNGLRLVDAERFGVADVSVAAQMAKIKSAEPDVIMTWTAGSGFGTLLHGIADSGMNVPVTGCSCNLILDQLHGYSSIMPKEMLFPGQRSLVEGSVAKGPLRDAQTSFFTSLKTAGYRADMGYVIAWDPALVLVDAYRRLGTNATATELRDYLEQMHGFVGINALYDFRDRSQRGIGENGAAVVRFNPATNDFSVVSKPGGHIK